MDPNTKTFSRSREEQDKMDPNFLERPTRVVSEAVSKEFCRRVRWKNQKKSVKPSTNLGPLSIKVHPLRLNEVERTRDRGTIALCSH